MPVHINSYSCCTVPLRLYFRDTLLSSATGFIYERNNEIFLITNWHVVTLKHPQNLTNLDAKRNGIPDRIEAQLPPVANRKSESLGVALHREPMFYPLYSDADNPAMPDHPKVSQWYVHPDYRHKVDVVAIPLNIPIAEAPLISAMAINNIEGIPDLEVAVSTSVFILGHPLGIGSNGPRPLPVWKRGSVASEPDLPWDGLPCMLIDSATREGMSGAPVIVYHRGLGYPKAGGQLGGAKIAGGRFVGVYSSRLAGNMFDAQIGQVWNAKLVAEIIDAKVPGESSFFISKEERNGESN